MSNRDAGGVSGRDAGGVGGRDAGGVSNRGAGAGHDRGAASILVLAVGLMLVAAGMAGAAVGAARVGRHEARTAADLGALAGAQRAIEGEPVACAAAARFVTANGAVLTRCDVQGLEIVIYVEVPVLSRKARAGARAGPR
ncbi:MAG TPA: Rv3654c family TadE-like protein [Actinoplanes sp.]|nr:Rv3654c family TadE-like protein [Actinoplanes sp.]